MALKSPGHRSVNQSSLQSTHRTHESTSNPPRQRSPSQPRLPFQSLNETSVLLRPPGPLESMLKTTTETGDLGIYSINLPSLGTRHHQPRSRDSHGDKKRQSRSRQDGPKYGATRDDRKLLPSYRDPTSEILSLYGGSRTPCSRSYSPTSEDQRSHSLTTCSSRRVPSYKSSGIFSSQQSNSGLQRPRSPFPYPARLKRPGIRPSSPAVADNGLVGYREMVEIDRSAHRTTSGSYMTRGCLRYRQYPPLSLRPECSRSTSSLPIRTSSAHYYESVLDSSEGLIQVYPKSPYSQFVAGDQSIRSASPTSVVEMYQCRSPDGSTQPIRSPYSVYYDYTEERDEEFPDKLSNESPVCSPGGNFKNISPGNAVQDASGEIDTPGRKSNGIKSALSISSIHRRLIGELNYGTNNQNISIPTKRSYLSFTPPVQTQPVINQLEPSDSSDDDWVWDKPEGDAAIKDSPIVRGVSCLPSKATGPCLHERRPQTNENDAVIKLPSCQEHHCLNANTTIGDEGHTNKQVTDEKNVQESNAHATILSPNPISPTHQLRLSNNITQLMKPLPPLPHEKQCNSQNPCAASYEYTKDHTRISFAGSPIDTSIAVRPGSGTGKTSLEPVFGGKDLRTPSHQWIQSQPQMNQSRFKVRVKSSQSTGLHSKWIADSPKVPGRSSSSPVKPRLRLKVSRNRVSKLGNVPRREASSDGSSFGEALEEQLVQINSDKRLSNIDEGTARGRSPQISDQFDISYPSPAEEIIVAELVPRSNRESSPDPPDRQQQNFVNRPSLRPLRYKTPGLQSNRATKVEGMQLWAPSNIHEINLATLGCDIVSDSDKSTLAPSQITVMLSQRLRNKTLRVKRWVLELKRTVQISMRRAHNRRQ
ncbi:hypothetical protein EDB82DRAFT_576855 [Fusarium venenatum]|uniref:uncharacterized protein n=1 Tax=Fusarium venenatum TaxID=56646 RepID=UPI001DAB99B3|nr:hypothetical protein EDB82DRAFT_576855 [Fusarium venenatum]